MCPSLCFLFFHLTVWSSESLNSRTRYTVPSTNLCFYYFPTASSLLSGQNIYQRSFCHQRDTLSLLELTNMANFVINNNAHNHDPHNNITSVWLNWNENQYRFLHKREGLKFFKSLDIVEHRNPLVCF